MYMGYDIYLTLHGNPPKAIVSPFLKSAKKAHLGKGATMLQTLGRSESDEARIEGTKRLRFEGEARIEGEIFPQSLEPSTLFRA